ncbi:hypothetical protein [Paenibacillus wenxiniae]|uniref:DUF4367 domain-containing protein n=1 Tax=Paenibacillus wenxiniae TaxID=1636843 RepID=A0ABW4RQA1_9BACL
MTLTSEPRKRNKYNEIMERIQVTPEMHERIMERIRTADITKANTAPAKPSLWTRYQKYMVAAASMIVVLAGVLAAQHGFAPGTGQEAGTSLNAPETNQTAPRSGTSVPPQASDMKTPYSTNAPSDRAMIITGAQSYDSLAALTKAAGYHVKQVNALPFKSEQTQYSLSDKLAELVYTGSNNVLTFRMQPGSGDISGDYGDYSDTRIMTENGASITIKGNDKRFTLATWEQNGYTYSMSVQQPISSEQLLAAVHSVK